LISKRDVQLGKLALRQGMVTKDQINRCLALKKKLAKTKGKNVALGALLLKKGYLDKDQLEEIVALHNTEDGDGDKKSGRKKRRSARSKAVESADSREDGDEADAAAAKKEARRSQRRSRRSKRVKADEAATADEARDDGEEPDDDAKKRKAKESLRRQKSLRRKKEAAKAEEGGEEGADDEAAKKKARPKAKKKAKAKGKGKGKAASRRSKRQKAAPTPSDVDPAVFQSAPEDAVDQEDRRIIACPECGKKYRIKPKQVGKRFSCRRCRGRVKVPKDLFQRPLQPAGGPDEEEPSASGSGDLVEEFTLSSADMEPTDEGSGEGRTAAATAVKPAPAKAKAKAKTTQRKSGKSITELAEAATTAQKRPLAPKRKFGARQAITLVVCVGLLVGIVGGAVLVKQGQEAALAEKKAAEVADQLDGWRGRLDAELARADELLAEGTPIQLGGVVSDIEKVRKEKEDLYLGDNAARAAAYEAEVGVEDELRALHTARGDRLFAEGGFQVEEAVVAYREAADVDPSHVETQVRLGQILIQARRCEEAVGRLEPIAAGSDAVRALVGLAYERGDDAAAAAKAYGQVSDPLGPILAARARLAARDTSRALDTAEAASGLEGVDRAAAAVLKALVHEAKGDSSRAESAFREAVSASDQSPFPLVARAEFRLRQGEIEAALEDAETAARIFRTARGQVALGDARAALLDLQQARIAYENAAEVAHLPPEARLVGGVVDPFAPPHAQDPSAVAACRLAALERAGGETSGAAELYAEALQRDPFHAEAEAGMAHIEILADEVGAHAPVRVERALSLCQRLGGVEAGLVESPETAYALLVQGALRLAEGVSDEALAALGRAVEIDPTLRPQVESLRARVYEQLLTQDRDAARAYRTAVAHEATDETPSGRIFGRARAFFQQHRADLESDRAKARRIEGGVLAALARNPYNAHAHVLRARLQIATGRAKAALPPLDRAEAINPYFVDTFVVRGFLLVRDLPNEEITQQTTAQAAKDFEVANTLERGQDADTHYGRAVVAFRQNDYPRALQALEKCLELEPQHAAALELKETIEERSGG